MTEATDRLPEYLTHLQARIRERQHRLTAADRESGLATLPPSIDALCAGHPRECLDLIIRALAGSLTPEGIAVIGDGLLQDLLNGSAGTIADEVSSELRRNTKFRQAFGFGNHSSVDPAVIEEWVSVLESLGTTKERERKSTWRRH